MFSLCGLSLMIEKVVLTPLESRTVADPSFWHGESAELMKEHAVRPAGHSLPAFPKIPAEVITSV